MILTVAEILARNTSTSATSLNASIAAIGLGTLKSVAVELFHKSVACFKCEGRVPVERPGEYVTARTGRVADQRHVLGGMTCDDVEVDGHAFVDEVVRCRRGYRGIYPGRSF